MIALRKAFYLALSHNMFTLVLAMRLRQNAFHAEYAHVRKRSGCLRIKNVNPYCSAFLARRCPLFLYILTPRQAYFTPFQAIKSLGSLDNSADPLSPPLVVKWDYKKFSLNFALLFPFPFPVIPGNNNVSFPIPTFGNGISIPVSVPKNWEWNFHSRSSSQKLGIQFIIPVPVPKVWEWVQPFPFPFPNVQKSCEQPLTTVVILGDCCHTVILG